MSASATMLICMLMVFGLSACNSEMTSTESIPDENSLGAKILKKNCSSCHGVPQPSVHKADEWANVVDRMDTHRVRRAYGALSQLDKQELITYLKKHAAL